MNLSGTWTERPEARVTRSMETGTSGIDVPRAGTRNVEEEHERLCEKHSMAEVEAEVYFLR